MRFGAFVAWADCQTNEDISRLPARAVPATRIIRIAVLLVKKSLRIQPDGAAIVGLVVSFNREGRREGRTREKPRVGSRVAAHKAKPIDRAGTWPWP